MALSFSGSGVGIVDVDTDDRLRRLLATITLGGALKLDVLKSPFNFRFFVFKSIPTAVINESHIRYLEIFETYLKMKFEKFSWQLE